MYTHTLQFQSLCSMKSFRERLQNLPYYIYFLVDIDCNKSKLAINAKGKKKIYYWVFLFQKYGKFWRVSLELFVEHEPWNCEECGALTDSFTFLCMNGCVWLINNLILKYVINYIIRVIRGFLLSFFQHWTNRNVYIYRIC